LVEKEKLKRLGKVIRKMRLEKGLSQSELANNIGKDRSSISRLEIGGINPTYLYLEEVAFGLELPLHELLAKL